MEFVETTEEIGDRIRRQLARIESHPLFVRSLRMRRFLEFTIERRLAGKADELKEYVLGVEVFDRRIDPIVRVEARRLRAKLRDFYESAGAEEELMIEYPLGSYVPRFQLRSTPPR
jgi:hypothetical protein